MRPILQALLLCDRVYIDTAGKAIIAGVFDRWCFRLPKPAASGNDVVELGAVIRKSVNEIQDVGTPWVFISLTDVKGPTKLELRFEELTGSEVYFSADIEVTSEDPLGSIKVGLPVPRLPNKAGDYILDLLHEDVSLGSHRVKIEEFVDASS